MQARFPLVAVAASFLVMSIAGCSSDPAPTVAPTTTLSTENAAALAVVAREWGGCLELAGVKVEPKAFTATGTPGGTMPDVGPVKPSDGPSAIEVTLVDGSTWRVVGASAVATNAAASDALAKAKQKGGKC